MTTPILKWVGGKTRLLPELLARVPSNYGRYYEPFAGGAALFFKLAPARATLGDANPEVINLYRVLAGSYGLIGVVDALIALLEQHQERHYATPRDHYYHVRESWNTATWDSPVQRAAAFVYLNRTCFNGLWRVNSKGEFNVPMGAYKRPTICFPDELRAASKALRGAEMRDGHFASTVKDAKPGDFVYFDPPYVPASATSDFTDYTSGGFGMRDQELLADTARDLALRGVHVVLSNSDTPVTRALYASWGFTFDVVQCGRSINSDGAKRGAVSELIVTWPQSARVAEAVQGSRG